MLNVGKQSQFLLGYLPGPGRDPCSPLLRSPSSQTEALGRAGPGSLQCWLEYEECEGGRKDQLCSASLASCRRHLSSVSSAAQQLSSSAPTSYCWSQLAPPSGTAGLSRELYSAPSHCTLYTPQQL